MIASRVMNGDFLLGYWEMDEEIYRFLIKQGYEPPLEEIDRFTAAMEMALNAAFAVENIPNTINKVDKLRLVIEHRKNFLGFRMMNLADAFDAGRALRLYQNACYRQDDEDVWHKRSPADKEAALDAQVSKIGGSLKAYDENGVRHNVQGKGVLAIAAVSDIFHVSVHEAPDHYPVNLCYVRTIAGFRLGR